MKYSRFFAFILLQLLLLFSCSQKKESLTEFTQGNYNGSYRIQDGDYLQYGLVNLTFQDSTYKQGGIIEYPTDFDNMEFQLQGVFFIHGDTVVFNPDCDKWSKVTPIWFLCGPFVYHLEEGMTIYEQRRDPSFVYRISLNEKK